MHTSTTYSDVSVYILYMIHICIVCILAMYCILLTVCQQTDSIVGHFKSSSHLAWAKACCGRPRQYFLKQEQIYQCQDFSNHIFFVCLQVVSLSGMCRVQSCFSNQSLLLLSLFVFRSPAAFLHTLELCPQILCVRGMQYIEVPHLLFSFIMYRYCTVKRSASGFNSSSILLPSSLASIQVPKETGGEDVNTVSAGMGRWLAAVRVTVGRKLNEPDSQWERPSDSRIERMKKMEERPNSDRRTQTPTVGRRPFQVPSHLNPGFSQFSYSELPFARWADADQHLSIPAVLSGALTQPAPFQVSYNMSQYAAIQYYTILCAAVPLTSFDTMRRIATLASTVSSLINHVKQLLAARLCKATLSIHKMRDQ